MSNGRKLPQGGRYRGRHKEPSKTLIELAAPGVTGVKLLAVGALGSAAVMAALPTGAASAAASPVAATLTADAQQTPAASPNTTFAPAGQPVTPASPVAAALTGTAQLSVPAKGTDPAQVNSWWQGLTADQQQQVTNSNLAAIGSLDGIPAAVRDYANRQVVSNQLSTDPSQPDSLANTINTLTNQRNDLQNQLYNLENPANPWPSTTEPSGTLTTETSGTLQYRIDNLNNQLDSLQTQMGGLQALQSKIAPDGNLLVPFPTSDATAQQPVGAPQMFLLGVDVPGAAGLGTSNVGQFIVAAGNPDTAQNVATIVTGMNSKLDSEFVNYYVGAASNLQGQATVAAPDQTTSVITWYGYNAPQSVASASWAAPAVAAAPALQQFQAGLSATNGDAGNLNPTVIGHSYGSVVVGEASQLPGGLNANQVAVVGSPGMDVATADAVAAGIGVVPGTSQVFAGKNTTDIISLAPGMGATGWSVPVLGDTLGHGTDPTSPGFGATVFDTGNGQPGSVFNPITGDYFTYSRAAHSEYFDWGNPALANMGNIVTGNFGAVTTQGTAALEQDLATGKYSGILPPSLANELGIPASTTVTSVPVPGDTGIDGITSWPTQTTTLTAPAANMYSLGAAPDATAAASPAGGPTLQQIMTMNPLVSAPASWPDAPPAANPAGPSAAPNSPGAGQQSAPGAGQQSAPGDQPSAPGGVQPAAPADQPSAPSGVQPSAPGDQPSAPSGIQPSAPGGVQPSAPSSGQTAPPGGNTDAAGTTRSLTLNTDTSGGGAQTDTSGGGVQTDTSGGSSAGSQMVAATDASQAQSQGTATQQQGAGQSYQVTSNYSVPSSTG